MVVDTLQPHIDNTVKIGDMMLSQYDFELVNITLHNRKLYIAPENQIKSLNVICLPNYGSKL